MSKNEPWLGQGASPDTAEYVLADLACGCQDVYYPDRSIDREHDHVQCDGPGAQADGPEFPEGYQGAGPMYAAVPMGEQWLQLAVRDATTYVAENPYGVTPGVAADEARAEHEAYAGWSVFLDRADAEQVADARDGMYVRYEGLAAYNELTPAREAMFGEPKAY